MSVLAPTHDGYVQESDDIEGDTDYNVMLSDRNSYQYNYGNMKRLCEKSILERHIENTSFPYTILRLPDVFGEYDNQGAWADNILMVVNKLPIPAQVQPDLMRYRPFASSQFKEKHYVTSIYNDIDNSGSSSSSSSGIQSIHDKYLFSVVYAKDVINAIIHIMETDNKEYVMNQIFNIANDEPITVERWINSTINNLGLPYTLDTTVTSRIPTTDFGPLNVSKALAAIKGWRPTPIDIWFATLQEWYRHVSNIEYHYKLRQAAADSSSTSTTDDEANEFSHTNEVSAAEIDDIVYDDVKMENNQKQKKKVNRSSKTKNTGNTKNNSKEEKKASNGSGKSKSGDKDKKQKKKRKVR
jgi:nucleoside-diphosphate-sugar epimerase